MQMNQKSLIIPEKRRANRDFKKGIALSSKSGRCWQEIMSRLHWSATFLDVVGPGGVDSPIKLYERRSLTVGIQPL